MKNLKIELGKKYKDVISGFTGIATSTHEYLNGCIRLNLTSTELKDGKPVYETFDIEQLELVDSGVVKQIKLRAAGTGGPGQAPAPRHIPTR